MNPRNIHADYRSGDQPGEALRHIDNPDILPSRSELTSLLTHKSGFLHDVINHSSTADLYFFSMDTAQRELAAIREEVEDTCVVANDVEPVPESAYRETFSLLTRIHHNIPMPDIMWLEDGGIGLEWRPGDGIVTMSLYGDNHVTFVAILGNQHEIAGTCPLSDSRILPSFLATLPLLFRQRM